MVITELQESILVAPEADLALKASISNFDQNFNIHTPRCDFLHIHDEQVP